MNAVMKCEYADAAAGPHDGCVEFAPMQYFECSNDATQLVVVEMTVAVLGGPSTEYEKLALCEYHRSVVGREVALDRQHGSRIVRDWSL